MSGRGESPRGASDTLLLWVLGGVLVVLLVALTAHFARRSRRTQVAQDFDVAWTLAPRWPGPPAPQVDHGEPIDLAIHLDESQPLGGFLAPSGDEPSDFELVVEQIPDQLDAAGGSSHSHLGWLAVTSDVHAIAAPEPLRRIAFDGKESRLDLAIAKLLRDFAEGHLRAAVLVTDLISTGELTGAMGVARALSDWMSSGAIRNRSFHAGLLGVRAAYWGVASRHCPAPRGTRCWFSEQAKAWRPLAQPVKVPFYALVLGRREEEVRAIGEHLLATAAGRHLDARWELLSAAATPRALAGRCRFEQPGERGAQFVLARHADGRFECLREEPLEIRCPLPPGAQLAAPQVAATWSGVRAELRGGEAVATIDCGALRDELPRGDLSLRVTGSPAAGPGPTWKGWPTETDATAASLGRTLGLATFLETVRPRLTGFDLTSGPLLKGKRDDVR